MRNGKYIFYLGLVIVLVATTIETLRGRATNFYDYYDATNLFWSGIDPYTQEFVSTRSIW